MARTAEQTQRDGAFTLSIIFLVLGISLGTNYGLHEVCKNKDAMISTLNGTPKVQKEQTIGLPKNLSAITSMR